MEMNNSTVNSTTANNGTWSCQRRPPTRSEGIAFSVVLIVESFAIIIGNAIVIAVFSKNRQLRKRTYYLLINLAIADFLVGVIAVPWLLSNLDQNYHLWKHEWNRHTVIVAKVIGIFSTFASLINLMMISLERMYATLWPLKHRVLETKTYYVLIGLCWILPILPVSINLAAYRYAIIPMDRYLEFSLSFICFLLVIICVTYSSIWIKMKFGRPQHHVTTAQDRKLTVSLFLVTALSLVTWLPFQTLYFAMLRFQPMLHGCFVHLFYSLALLLLANSLVNPIIYSFRMPQFRQAVLRLVCRRSAERRMEAIKMRNEAEVR